MHDEGMTTDWARLAIAIRERREALGISRQQLADSAGVALETIKNLEGRRTPKRIPSSVPMVEQGLGWAPGSARAILAGGGPTEAPVEADVTFERNTETTDEAATWRSAVFEAFVVAAPDTPASAIQEIADRLLDAARNYGYGAPRRRHETHTQDDPEA